jgi:hypothetical protein
MMELASLAEREHRIVFNLPELIFTRFIPRNRELAHRLQDADVVGGAKTSAHQSHRHR